jgi:hypothetical protein
LKLIISETSSLYPRRQKTLSPLGAGMNGGKITYTHYIGHHITEGDIMKSFNEWMGQNNKITKKQAVDMLFSVLEACNLADSDQNTDFPPEAASQRSTYGHVANAIKSLGASSEYDHWVHTSERL